MKKFKLSCDTDDDLKLALSSESSTLKASNNERDDDTLQNITLNVENDDNSNTSIISLSSSRTSNSSIVISSIF